MARLYGALCVVGAAFPLYFLGSFVADEGIDARSFWGQATATDLALMAWVDVIVAGATVIALAARERARGLSAWWLVIVATLLVGPSLGLPLLLLLRERKQRGRRIGTAARLDAVPSPR
jgi:MFS-type transporter involved in bile tolerance (Atg22 family)